MPAPSPRWSWTLRSAVGPLVAQADAEGALLSLSFGEAPALGQADAAPFLALQRWLDAWSARAPVACDVPLAPAGTDFQRRVWAELQTLPFGRTITYGELAGRLGGATLTRAVGRANGKNPIAIVVPCHRVVGSGGALVGYAGGLAMKRRLLDHEQGGAAQLSWLG